MKTKIAGMQKRVRDKAALRPAYQGLLLMAVVLSALSVVTSQHKARKLFIELQKEKERAQQMEVEWGQLQLEQSTWAAPARVEQVAVQKLQMQLPRNGQVQYIRIKTPSPQPSEGTTSHLTNPATDAGQVIGYPAEGEGAIVPSPPGRRIKNSDGTKPPP